MAKTYLVRIPQKAAGERPHWDVRIHTLQPGHRIYLVLVWGEHEAQPLLAYGARQRLDEARNLWLEEQPITMEELQFTTAPGEQELEVDRHAIEPPPLSDNSSSRSAPV